MAIKDAFNRTSLLCGVVLLLMGCVSGWAIQRMSHGGLVWPYGTNGDCAELLFRSESVIQPIEMDEHVTTYLSTWKWSFRNRTDKPIAISIPKQTVNIHCEGTLFGTRGRSISFMDIPNELIVEDAVILQPGEERTFTGHSGGHFTHSHGLKPFATEVVVKVDSVMRILGAETVITQP